EAQQVVKEALGGVLEGQGVGWFTLKRCRRLLDSESLRLLLLGKMSRSGPSGEASSTVLTRWWGEVTRKVYKGMLDLMKCCVSGLESSYACSGVGGMSSVFSLLEIAYTHYYSKQQPPPKIQLSRAPPKGTSTQQPQQQQQQPQQQPQQPPGGPVVGGASPPRGVGAPGGDSRSLKEEQLVASIGQSTSTSTSCPEGGGGEDGEEAVVRGEEGEEEVVRGEEGEEVVVRNRPALIRSSSQESESNTMLSSSSGETLGADSDCSSQGGQGEGLGGQGEGLGASSAVSSSSAASSSAAVSSSSATSTSASSAASSSSASPSSASTSSSAAVYLYEGLLGRDRFSVWDQLEEAAMETFSLSKERSTLWDQAAFWEAAFLDAVAQEREALGMDRGLRDMMERYSSLGDSERRRLEEEEDHLLSVLLHNMVAFMSVMK
ncbi:unnamed protein product, partial [Lampetra fluviatilis]